MKDQLRRLDCDVLLALLSFENMVDGLFFSIIKLLTKLFPNFYILSNTVHFFFICEGKLFFECMHEST